MVVGKCPFILNASMPKESSTVRFADKSAMTSAHVTFLSSGVDRGPIADAAGLEDEVRSSSSASGAKELDVARGTTIALGVDGVPSALRATVEITDTSQKLRSGQKLPPLSQQIFQSTVNVRVRKKCNPPYH